LCGFVDGGGGLFQFLAVTRDAFLFLGFV